ncbi:MAG: organic solvent transporter substrate-binding protein [Frankiales bacterium]|jgi:phospholipid/cholesterol/gamma-HCH transport system substrate-binding protein|nr:organic solvent transporter substrate-binding protein [Frankiales bacterium]
MTRTLPRLGPRGRRQAPVLGVAAVALVALTAGATSQRVQQDDALELTAVFTDASALIPGNEVKVGGVTAGKVDSIQLVKGKAVMTFTVAPQFLPVHRDAKAVIKPVSLLGERYVDLDTGSAAAPLLEDGAELPPSQTGRLADLDEVLDVVDEPTGEALAATLTTLGIGVRGNGAAAGTALRTLPGALQDADELVGILREQNGTLNELVDAVTPVAASLGADRGKRLDGLVDSASLLLDTTARRQAALRQTLQVLPATLREARSRLAALAATSEQATPLLQDVRPVTSDIREISGELDRLGRTVDPALASLQPVLEKAQQLVTQARPVAADLEAAGPAARSAARDAAPVALGLIGDDQKLSNLLEFIRNWALTTNGRDGLSHYFRAHAIISEETLMGPVPVDTPVKGITKNLPSLAGKAPTTAAPTTVLPKLPGRPTLPLVDPGSATGLTVEQEKSLLGTLLGGRR